MAEVGTELELFLHALNWKRYFAGQIAPHLGARVLEVGAGVGGTTAILCRDPVERWVCLEPEAHLYEQIAAKIAAGELPAPCECRRGDLADLPSPLRFDAILYIDVLEHIEDDLGELARAAHFLSDGGRLVVLAPAHEWLMSPFDVAIGHHRRYTRRSLRAVVPAGLEPVLLRYLDCAGVMASGANRVLMRQGMPTRNQLRFWDRVLVPCSRILDPLTAHRLGKSLLGVWRRPGP